MRLFTVFCWFTVILSFIRWQACWRLAGGITFDKFMRECRRASGNMQGLLFWSGIASIVLLPFNLMFDLAPPQLIHLQIPLTITVILGTTSPVSFLVLGPSGWSTSETCSRLAGDFPLYRAGAAIDPMKLGAVLDHSLGPSGSLWMSESHEPWFRQLIQMIEDAPIIVFDGRVLTDNTVWELFHLLMSPQLPKVIIVGPVGNEALREFLHGFDGVPIVAQNILGEVIKAAAGSRVRLLEWYARRRRAILAALSKADFGSERTAGVFDPSIEYYTCTFREALLEVIALYGAAVRK